MESGDKPSGGSAGKRVRTGCLTCRKRRRKCDERKPTCQNCEEKSLECRYGVNLSFRGANAMGVGPEHSTHSPKYPRIKFVNDLQGSQTEGEGSSHSGRTDGVMAGDAGKRRASFAGVLRRGSSQHDNNLAIDSFAIVDSPEQSPALHSVPGVWSASHGQTSQQWGPQHATSSRSASDAQAHQIYSRTSTSIDNVHITEVSCGDSYTVELMVHYRYYVAPWLDIWDWMQPFGLAIPLLAAESAPVLSSILSLSACHLRNIGHDLNFRESQLEQGYNLQAPINEDPGSDREVRAISVVLQLTRDLMYCSSSQAWEPHIELATDQVGWLSQYALEFGILPGLFWCLLRLDLGTALIRRIPAKLPAKQHIPSQSALSYPPVSLPDKDNVYRHARDALQLCAQATLITTDVGIDGFGSVGSTPQSPQSPHNFATRWQFLWDQVQEWYRNRPAELCPVFEGNFQPSEGQTHDHGFTQILFTTGAGSSSNMLYHNASLILLQNKPRTTKLASQRPPVSSILWHCLRICSIANTLHELNAWDVPLLGSLMSAARHMTHESQHQIITQTLERAVNNLPGWDIDTEIRALKEHWELATGY